jgi:hypothetical protein
MSMGGLMRGAVLLILTSGAVLAGPLDPGNPVYHLYTEKFMYYGNRNTDSRKTTQLDIQLKFPTVAGSARVTVVSTVHIKDALRATFGRTTWPGKNVQAVVDVPAGQELLVVVDATSTSGPQLAMIAPLKVNQVCVVPLVIPKPTGIFAKLGPGSRRIAIQLNARAKVRLWARPNGKPYFELERTVTSVGSNLVLFAVPVGRESTITITPDSPTLVATTLSVGSVPRDLIVRRPVTLQPVPPPAPTPAPVRTPAPAGSASGYQAPISGVIGITPR